MCKIEEEPRPATATEPRTIRVLISGAGPAGLLCASLLLARNTEPDSNTIYQVTLVDGRQDFGNLSKEELSKSFRSWMIGLANHGCDALREVPGLYEDYVKGVGVQIDEFNIFLGSKPMSSKIGDDDSTNLESFIVDRNFITASIARYITETHANNKHYTAMYDTSCLYVDYENKQVLTRNKNNLNEVYVPYDLLIGCDGIRSVVREAMIKRHSNFAVHVRDIFQEFKAVHVTKPPSLNPHAMSVLPNIFPGFQGIALPETGNMVNISCGTPLNIFDSMEDNHALKSGDYKVVAEYLKDNFKAFKLEDYDDFAKQWVGQRWNQTGMVNCNFYHSCEAGIVLMGDAAHATSPSIGMGMNTALRDAQMFYRLLKQHEDDLSVTLPAFSKERVKEGNSLSNLAYYLNCSDKTTQTLETFHLIIRTFLNKLLPSLISKHPMTMIGRKGVPLSECYDLASKLNIISRHRAINDQIRNDHFEMSTGMIKKSYSAGLGKRLMVWGSVAAAVAGVAYSAYF